MLLLPGKPMRWRQPPVVVEESIALAKAALPNVAAAQRIRSGVVRETLGEGPRSLAVGS
jgi:hypothetical protein